MIPARTHTKQDLSLRSNSADGHGSAGERRTCVRRFSTHINLLTYGQASRRKLSTHSRQLVRLCWPPGPRSGASMPHLTRWLSELQEVPERSHQCGRHSFNWVLLSVISDWRICAAEGNLISSNALGRTHTNTHTHWYRRAAPERVTGNHSCLWSSGFTTKTL